MGLHQIKKLLHSKGENYQTEETTCRWERISVSCSSNRGLVSEQTESSKKLNTIIKNNLVNEWANELSSQFSRNYKWPITT
jgi:hypothetical protein